MDCSLIKEQTSLLDTEFHLCLPRRVAVQVASCKKCAPQPCLNYSRSSRQWCVRLTISKIFRLDMDASSHMMQGVERTHSQTGFDIRHVYYFKTVGRV